MRTMLLLIPMLVLLVTGCAVKRHGAYVAEGLTPAQAQAMAEDAAIQTAAAYPPGHTALALPFYKDRAPGPFGAALEQALRARGFAIEPGGLGVAYIVDALRGEPGLWYLHMAIADGFAFARTYATASPASPDSPGAPLTPVDGVTQTGRPAQ